MRSTVQKCCVLGSMFAFVVLVAFACLNLLEIHLLDIEGGGVFDMLACDALTELF